MICDSHCHLLFYPKEEIPEIVRSARENGVGILHNISTKLSETDDLLALCEEFPDIYCSVGVHPNYAELDNLLDQKLISLGAHRNVISIGETGLDYYYNYTSQKTQKKAFATHIKAALELNLPVVVHSRNAEKDTADILEAELGNSKIAVILHSFASSRELFEAAMKHSWYVSFSGIVTFKNASEIQQIAREVPIERMLIETDAPYLAPVPMRGKKNYPSYIVHVLSYLSFLRGMEKEELSERLLKNFLTVFSKVRAPTE